MIILLYHLFLVLIGVWVYENASPLFPKVLTILLIVYLLPVAVSAVNQKFHPYMFLEPLIIVVAFAFWFTWHTHQSTPFQPMQHWVTCYAADGATTDYYGPPEHAPNPCLPQAYLGFETPKP